MTTETRAAVVRIGPEELAQLLSLPQGWSVIGVRDDWLRDSILVKVTGPDAPTITPGAYPYEIRPVEMHYEPPPDDAPPYALGRLTVCIDWDEVPRS